MTTDPALLVLYYLDGPSSTKAYTDQNTPTGYRWRDGRGACYEVTAETREVPRHGMVRIVRRVLCTFPPEGAIVMSRASDGEWVQAAYLGFDDVNGRYFTLYESLTQYEMFDHDDREGAEAYLAVLVSSRGAGSNWTREDVWAEASSDS